MRIDEVNSEGVAPYTRGVRGEMVALVARIGKIGESGQLIGEGSWQGLVHVKMLVL